MYTIRFKSSSVIVQGLIHDALANRLDRSSLFVAKLTSGMNNKGKLCIFVKPVRLRKAKPYCGAHPGECVINSIFGIEKKKNGTWLEWSDWIKFHKIVNITLNKYKVDADVWSNPHDVKGKFWIRKGLKARKKYDWTDDYVNGNRVQTWNSGDDSQF